MTMSHLIPQNPFGFYLSRKIGGLTRDKRQETVCLHTCPPPTTFAPIRLAVAIAEIGLEKAGEADAYSKLTSNAGSPIWGRCRIRSLRLGFPGLRQWWTP